MTGYALVGAGQSVLERTGLEWIQKPFDINDLVGKIRAVLDEAAPPVHRARWQRDNG